MGFKHRLRCVLPFVTAWPGESVFFGLHLQDIQGRLSVSLRHTPEAEKEDDRQHAGVSQPARMLRFIRVTAHVVSAPCQPFFLQTVGLL
jgi:hypothetical protein